MKKIVVFIPVLWLHLSARAQHEIKEYVQTSTANISAISPAVTQYDDLQIFGDAIGDANVVMLGEQDHGDAATFEAKSRLIKYLHEKKGFNVLAFESQFTLTYIWQQAVKNHVPLDSITKKYVTQLWSMCNACNDLLYQYVPGTYQHGVPLQLAGVDSNVFNGALVSLLDSVIRANQLPISQDPDYAPVIIPMFRNWLANAMSKDQTLNNKYLGYLAKVKEQLGQHLNKEDFWMMYLDNLEAGNKHLTIKEYYPLRAVRDKQMAANLSWMLRNVYKGEKIIVWAHNFHISKYSGQYEDKTMNEAMTMGTYFTDSPEGKNTYILGFTSYEGTTGRLYVYNNGNIKDYKLNKPKTNSFENWVNGSYDFAFTDFKKFNAAHPGYKEEFDMSGAVKGGAYHKNYKASWNNIFDGVFFIRKMYPCEWIK
jgi:erythromycin esterase-like protein